MSGRSNVWLSLPVASQPGGDDPRSQISFAARAEYAGLHGVIIAEHVVMGTHPERYPWGQFPFPADEPWLEPLTLLSAIAASTSSLHLTTGILIAAIRPAPLLAKIVATLDRLSDGRLELGVGTGWQQEELEACGVDHRLRGRALTDTIAACRELWSGGLASFSSDTVSFTDLWCEPQPTRPGGPPVLFSGTLTDRNLRRIVELGDGWITIMGATPDDVATGRDRLEDAYREAGRDPATIRIRVPLRVRRTVAASMEEAGPWVDAGATDVSLALAGFLREEGDEHRFFEAVAEHLR